MNLIKNLNKKIDEAKTIMDRYNSILLENPDNVTYQLGISTLEKHIADLQKQIKQEKDVREKEVIELRVKGQLADEGTIPLSILGDFAKNISNAIFSASQRIKSGRDPIGRIPRETIDTLNLRLAGIGTGSTRLFITGNTSPDIFGYSLLEESLTDTFELLNSETPEEITDSVSKVGVRSVASINKFLKKMSSSNLEIEMSWSSPIDIDFQWNGSKERALSISNTLESIKSDKPQELTVRGKLIMISLKGRFEIEGPRAFSYIGSYPSSLQNEITKLHVGDIVDCTIKKETIINESTAKEKNYYTLLSFSIV